jgi:predicted nucleic acid-binding protein
MSFLIDTDIASAHLRDNRVVTGRFLQYTGQLYISTVSLAELVLGLPHEDSRQVSPCTRRHASRLSDAAGR